MSTPFYDLASLVLVPSGYKASKVYAQKPLTTDGQLAFTRSTTATRVNSAGLIESVAINVPRLDYLNSTCPKLLLEPSRTNKQTNSEVIDTTNYSLSNEINVTANAGASPDGATNADKIIPTTTSAFHQVRSHLASVSGFDIISVFVKASGYNYVQLASWADPGNYVNFDLTDGTIGTASTATVYGIQSYGNGWYRVWANVQASGGGLVGIGVVTSKTAVWSQAFAGNGTDGVLMWGVQIEAATYATSYIPTLGAAVTRGADLSETASLQSASLIGATAGTFFVQTNKTDDVIWFNQRIFLTSTTQRALLMDTASGQIRLRTWDAASAGATITTSGLVNGVVKYLVKWDGTNVKVFANGISVGSSAQPSYAYATYAMYEGASFSNNEVSQVLFFPTALSDTDCIALTA